MYFLCFRGTGGSAIWKWQLYLLLSVWFHRYVDGQVRYSIPEEMTKGSFVGNIVQDLGLEVKRLKSGRARIFSEDSREYIGLNADKGTLLVKDRIDREELCAQVAPCSLHFQIILENPVELHRIDVEILDINDNSPVFPSKEIRLQISEGSLSGTRFPLENAMDPDVEMNSIQTYSLLPSDHFTLKQHSHSDGSKYLEMVLQTMLDRETNEQHILVLTAVDGGNPQKSGTVKIYIQVLDINDNAPVFSSVLYKSSLSEDTPKGTVILRVSATDSDKGTNGEVVYSFSHSTVSASDLFTVDPLTGEIKVNGKLDFETNKQHKISVQAMDRGSLTDSCKVQLDILDINDNDPVITLITFSNPIPEDASPETVIAMLNIKDLDSGRNGHIKCSVNSDLPFRIKSSSSNIYSLVTDQMLDREMVSEYNITITAVDEGFPPRSTNKTLTLRISDVNDNAPVFERHSYSAYVRENNSPGVSIFSLTASDKDTGNNARISYFIDDSHKDGLSASTFISVNSESGVIHAVRAFDYEQIKEFKICIKVQDGGSPPLSTNVTLTVFIQDQNDNAPQVLYPVQTGGSLGAEMVPRSADVGYLVTKVVAVDVDSGQNAWLSYKLQKATDRALFEVGLQNGEIRTIRQVIDKDAVKQKLTVVVEDNGQPSRSATVNVNVAVADSFPEVLSELTDFTQDKEYNNNLTFYLILALAVVSLLFIFSIISIISVKLYRWKQNKLFYKSAANLPVIPYYPPVYPDGTMETLQRVYNYEVCGTTDSRMSDVKFARPCSQNTLVDVSRMGTMQREKREQEDGDGEQKPPNNDWRFTQQGQRPGPSGAGPHPEGAGGAIVGTGPWPNPPTEAEQLQALMAAANEVSEATATLGPRYNAQFPMQHVPDYRQNVYIPGSTATLTANPQQMMPQPALQGPPQAMPQVDVPNAAQTPASKKKSTKKDKK
ncbi:protocadherin beta-16-like isoform X39 [Oncorhynchus tshawytscha]|uniref:protocadherin beta-16-like isoform X39 n=1 Tax=Oncorhynchus tshawytscha TaxID=74940 RepID=UPI001C3C75BB|nr:protocadherin beta-16-like isoform X39 [Oncorhynchus tshawytscha]